MDSLPAELLLYLIPFLPLTSLIAARAVSTKWRSLAQTASLHPARKALLDLYLTAIVHPNFSSLVEALQPHVRVFDREAYVANITSRGCVLPDVFELWVLEWPSKAIHFCAWPGLAKKFGIDHDDHFYGHNLYNLLGDPTPTINTIPFPKKEMAGVRATFQGLALWEADLWAGRRVARLWLVLDANERLNDRRAGRLCWTHSYYVDGLPGHGDEYPTHTIRDSPFAVDNMIEFLTLLDLYQIATVL